MEIFHKEFSGFEWGKLWETYERLGDEFLSEAFLEVLFELEENMHEFTVGVVSAEFG